MATIVCAYCKKESDKPIGHINRANKLGNPMYCDRKCVGLSRRQHKNNKQLKEEKRLYDAEYRAKNLSSIKEKKREHNMRTYDPVKAAISRKENMHRHIEYCRQPAYRAKKKIYDQEYRAKKDFGEFWEIQLLSLQIKDEVNSRMSKYQIRLESGLLNKSKQRKQHEQSDSKKLERRTLGNP